MKITLQSVLITLIIFLATSCINDTVENENVKDLSPNISDYYLFELKGKVKSFELNVYDVRDSLIDFKSFEFNVRKETIKSNYNNGRWEFNLYNKNGTNVKREVYVAGKLIEKKITIDSLDANDNVVKETTYDMNNKLFEIFNYSYSLNGDLTSMNLKRFNNGDFFTATYIYDSTDVLRKYNSISYDKDSIQKKSRNEEYNSFGNPTLKEGDFRKNSLHFRDVFKYDSLDRLIEQIAYSDDTISYWQRKINYNEDGLKIDSICQFHSPSNSSEEEIKIQREEIHEFNKSGKIRKKIFKRRGDGDREEVISTSILKYNENNILEKETITYSDNETTIIIYDNHGNETLKQFYDSQNNIVSEEKYDIEYDSRNNITKITYSKDGVIQITNIRKYEYY